jgi:hypothetical protein
MKGLMICKAGMYCDDPDILSDCLWAISYMADTDDDNTIGILASGETLPKVMECLGSKEFNLFVPALRCLGNIVTTNDPEVVDRAIFEGAFERLTSILFSSNSGLIKECCWAFSNITAGPPRHIEKLVDSTAFERIVSLSASYNIDHRKEALWVLCNAITGADSITKTKIVSY